MPATPAIRSTKKASFSYNTTLSLTEQMQLGGPRFEHAREITVEEGTIVFVQAYTETDVPYGLIPGFIASEWSESENGVMRTATVNPLTVAGQKKYRDKLSELVKGSLNFW